MSILNEIFKDLFVLENELNIVDVLKRDCAEYIQILKQSQLSGSVGANYRPLYRGMNSSPSTQENGLFVIAPRANDRNPKDTPKWIHNLLNRKFTEKFGYPFRNGIFATSSKSTAKDYGAPYVLFPIGKLEYCWSPDVDDLYSSVLEHNLTEEDWDPSPENTTRIYKLVDDIIATYQTTDLQRALYNMNEVMLANKCYVITEGMYNQIENQL